MLSFTQGRSSKHILARVNVTFFETITNKLLIRILGHYIPDEEFDQLCLYDIHCYTSDEERQVKPSTVDSTFDPPAQTLRYNATVAYECGLGLEFATSGQTQTMVCQADGTWTNSALETCVCKFAITNWKN